MKSGSNHNGTHYEDVGSCEWGEKREKVDSQNEFFFFLVCF